MQDSFSKVSLVMPWMHLDTLQSFIPGTHATHASVAQLEIVQSMESILLLCENAISPAQNSAEMAQIRTFLDDTLEQVVVARGGADAWDACMFLEQFRQRLRRLILWAVPNMCDDWRDIWAEAGTGVMHAAHVY